MACLALDCSLYFYGIWIIRMLGVDECTVGRSRAGEEKSQSAAASISFGRTDGHGEPLVGAELEFL